MRDDDGGGAAAAAAGVEGTCKNSAMKTPRERPPTCDVFNRMGVGVAQKVNSSTDKLCK